MFYLLNVFFIKHYIFSSSTVTDLKISTRILIVLGLYKQGETIKILSTFRFSASSASFLTTMEYKRLFLIYCAVKISLSPTCHIRDMRGYGFKAFCQASSNDIRSSVLKEGHSPVDPPSNISSTSESFASFAYLGITP